MYFFIQLFIFEIIIIIRRRKEFLQLFHVHSVSNVIAISFSVSTYFSYYFFYAVLYYILICREALLKNMAEIAIFLRHNCDMYAHLFFDNKLMQFN